MCPVVGFDEDNEEDEVSMAEGSGEPVTPDSRGTEAAAQHEVTHTYIQYAADSFNHMVY